MSEPIDIRVKANYLPDQSRPDDNRFVYAYTITIANRGESAAQLIARRWHIRDANDRIQEVHGAGVVGEQPNLAPGADFTYTSGVVLETETGIMKGSYQMRRDDGELFEANIPAFALAPPHAIH